MTDHNIKEKIKKLLALANDKGATEDEAATAMRMAMGLMARHGIEQSEMETGTAATGAKRGLRKTVRLDLYETILANAAGYLYGCRLITLNRGKAGYYYVGRQDNIDAAELTMLFLTEQVERFYKQALPKGLTQRERSEFRKTFKQACAARVQTRAYNLVEELKNKDVAAKAATGKNALVVKGYFDQMFSEADEEMKSIQNLKKPSKDRNLRYGSGTLAGLQAGDRVKLRQEVK